MEMYSRSSIRCYCDSYIYHIANIGKLDVGNLVTQKPAAIVYGIMNPTLGFGSLDAEFSWHESPRQLLLPIYGIWKSAYPPHFRPAPQSGTMLPKYVELPTVGIPCITSPVDSIISKLRS